ncbi:unnamed protein product [Acanthoscelides obtectus]|uniref:Uncharacterized protein n=1 Tax=Acanthoscelides obtectus TaxID=200917 RepID=A0A9P0VSJ0_ACAOB|nr:unnamed protein product [Acanthoscelides obtectus]CAK1682645.1 hypothetical protein AOBTE_LOCUS33755 [Acanthoscelides obtectus]
MVSVCSMQYVKLSKIRPVQDMPAVRDATYSAEAAYLCDDKEGSDINSIILIQLAIHTDSVHYRKKNKAVVAYLSLTDLFSTFHVSVVLLFWKENLMDSCRSACICIISRA